MDRIQLAVDSSPGWVAFISGVFSWFFQDVPIAMFGVPASVVLAGFAGAMAIISLLPPFETRKKMWSTVAICTAAAAYLTKVALKLKGWDMEYALGMAFTVGFGFQWVGQLLVQNGGKLFDAFLARIRGGP